MSQYPQWYYNEFKQTGVDYTDSEEIQAYDLRMQKLRDIESESNWLREILKIKDTDVILEIGTGTGELALKLSVYCRKVVAIDVL
jgi:putative AdoMet-dependent methyltransferase